MLSYEKIIYLVYCKHCGEHQVYLPKDRLFSGRSKRCMTCEKTFTIKMDNVVRKIK